ncbi:MAG: hypothetical protein PVG79_03355 [Gemmatimonadales bacterium]|jgi:hypothetical protein
MIEVKTTRTGDPFEFEVTVRKGKGETRHIVTMGKQTYQSLTSGKLSPEDSVEAAFRFLLDREPKESILQRFDVSVISRFFPDFREKLPDYF